MSSRTQRHTSWDELGYEESADTSTKAFFSLLENDMESPTIMKAHFPPDYVVPPHKHETDYAEIILEGGQQVGRARFQAGDIRVVRAGVGYGPKVAGPDGATVLLVFGTGQWPSIPAGRAATPED